VRPAPTRSTFFYPEGGRESPRRGGRARDEEAHGGAASFVKGRQRGTWCHDYVGNARTWGSPIAYSFGEGARGRVEGPLDARRHHDGWERQCLLRRNSKGRRPVRLERVSFPLAVHFCALRDARHRTFASPSIIRSHPEREGRVLIAGG